MWRNLKLLRKWRNFRFLHICHAYKSEISPHDKFFSTYLICDICEKYQVWVWQGVSAQNHNLLPLKRQHLTPWASHIDRKQTEKFQPTAVNIHSLQTALSQFSILCHTGLARSLGLKEEDEHPWSHFIKNKQILLARCRWSQNIFQCSEARLVIFFLPYDSGAELASEFIK